MNFERNLFVIDHTTKLEMMLQMIAFRDLCVNRNKRHNVISQCIPMVEFFNGCFFNCPLEHLGFCSVDLQGRSQCTNAQVLISCKKTKKVTLQKFW